MTAPPKSFQERLLRSITEAQWQNQVLQIAAWNGWTHRYHAPDNRPGPNGRVQAVRAGFPDLVLLRDDGPHHRLVFVELKRETGRVTSEQLDWLDRLNDVPGVEAYLWRPSDRPHVERLLARGWSVS